MSETFFIPREELRPRLASPKEVVAEELRMYPDAAAFRGGIKALCALYKKTNVMKSCAQSAYLLKIINYEDAADDTVTPDGLNDDFFAGEVFALHTMTRAMSTPARLRILSEDFGRYWQDSISRPDKVFKITEEDLAGLRTFHETSWQYMFKAQDSDFQSLLSEAAVREGEGRSDPEVCATDFKCGYMFTAGLIARISNTIAIRPYHL